MRPLLLSRIANWTGGRVHGTDVTVGAVSIDTRTLAASGEHDTLFVAIKGERFDGHDHAAAAVAAGMLTVHFDVAEPARSYAEALSHFGLTLS